MYSVQLPCFPCPASSSQAAYTWSDGVGVVSADTATEAICALQRYGHTGQLDTRPRAMQVRALYMVCCAVGLCMLSFASMIDVIVSRAP